MKLRSPSGCLRSLVLKEALTSRKAPGTTTPARCSTQETCDAGLGSSGQLGYKNTSSIGDNEAPAAAGNVNLGGFAVALSAGQNHTCALLDTGELRCFGDAFFGQLGYGNDIDVGDNETPVSVGSVSLGSAVLLLDAGSSHTCAALEDGLLRCFGQNSSGQLGIS